MRQGLIAVALLIGASVGAIARPQTTAPVATPSVADQFTFTRVMVPMKDGAKMETVIIAPKGKTKLPILFQRTPYGVPSALPPQIPASWRPLVADGYIFVFQSMRGRFGSLIQPTGTNLALERFGAGLATAANYTSAVAESPPAAGSREEAKDVAELTFAAGQVQAGAVGYGLGHECSAIGDLVARSAENAAAP